MNSLAELGAAAKKASSVLATAPEQQKNEALLKIAEALIRRSDEILEQNRADLDIARENGMPGHMLDRLALNLRRLEDAALGCAMSHAERPDRRGPFYDQTAQRFDYRQAEVPWESSR